MAYNPQLMRERVSGTSHRTRVPRSAVLEARQEIRNTLRSVARSVPRGRGVAPSEASPEALATFISANAGWLSSQEAGRDAACRLASLVNRPDVWELVSTSRAGWIYIGSCPVRTEALEECRERLYLQEGAATVRCRNCMTEGSIEWWRAKVAGNSQAWIDAQALAVYLTRRWGRSVAPTQIRSWARRNCQTGVASRRNDVRGSRTLYDFDSVVEWARLVWGPPAEG